MKIAIAQLNYHIGNFEGNLQKMLKATAEARGKGADLIVFGELATTGYPPRDFLEFRDFIRLAEESVDALREASTGIGIIVGSPTINPLPEGKDLYNSAYLLYNQETLHLQHKALLPTYDVFDEYRYFEPAKKYSTVLFKGKRIALTICEDLWNVGNENPLYTVCPMDKMMPDHPDFIVNVSASPFDYNHAAERLEVLKANVDKYQIPMFYSNICGAQTELIFDGGSMVLSPDGSVYDELPYFKEELRYYQLEDVIKGGYH
ncbi:MAG: nitrilase-related carbon-nitrogen hydrolase, partial [Saprospiraceae bacterium]|nr:nitrilase-related carbon-nitrogen hydrolase [Saprospiraceae bacterium]